VECNEPLLADPREVGRDGMDCIHLAHDRDTWSDLVNTVMNLPVQ
jgi:hypothetical protein